ncbi:uncharacterized protein LOC117210343 [Bombus bifarius]|uniref:Uncharacterized protein LOC117210343 n=1 Tax=Bombus bifarius TaxID=103933 RepID=A0A6P8MIG9_9HYME|nr:uncharacterized protein LOC117159468 [Bombus vancouverensis nearcticus]XP_033309174.1 uncharacterized protein LOC117210343 [Bombus bifarius]
MIKSFRYITVDVYCVYSRSIIEANLQLVWTESENKLLQSFGPWLRDKIECENTVALVKRECEDILEMSRETAEKQFHEVVELYNEAKEKVTRLEKRVEMYEGFGREQENRGFELANLLETLKRFDMDVGSVCQLTAEALKNLTERGNLFEESMKNLRHLAWIVKDRKDEPQLVLLREQNSVLRQVVKNLKRKVGIFDTFNGNCNTSYFFSCEF